MNRFLTSVMMAVSLAAMPIAASAAQPASQAQATATQKDKQAATTTAKPVHKVQANRHAKAKDARRAKDGKTMPSRTQTPNS